MNLLIEQLSPLNRLILAYAKPDIREGYALVFAFDSKCADIIRSTSEPLIGQMRLTWWSDILTMPAAERPAGEPLVAALNDIDTGGDLSASLEKLLDGWTAMLDEFPWDDRVFENYARGRGEGFFEAALNGELNEEQTKASHLWAYWDFARHCSDAAMRAAAFKKCQDIYAETGAVRFDKTGRPLSILCKLAAHDVRKDELSPDIYGPASAARIMWHGVTGI